MATSIYDLIYHFIFGGTLISLVTYLANNVSPRAASILISFPIGLIPLYLLRNLNKQRQLAFDTTITNILVVITYLSLDLIIRHGGYLEKNGEIIGMVIWTILAYITYLVSNKIGLE